MITQYYKDVELSQMHTVLMLIFIYIEDKNKNKFISEQKMKFDDNEILLINVLLEVETHTMGTTAIT